MRTITNLPKKTFLGEEASEDGGGGLDTRGERKKVAIACQGGGSHTAFTAGVLKKLLRAEGLKEGYEVVGLSGTSGGAVCALLAWHHLLNGDRAGAAEALDAFGETIPPRRHTSRSSTTGSSGRAISRTSSRCRRSVPMTTISQSLRSRNSGGCYSGGWILKK